MGTKMVCFEMQKNWPKKEKKVWLNGYGWGSFSLDRKGCTWDSSGIAKTNIIIFLGRCSKNV